MARKVDGRRSSGSPEDEAALFQEAMRDVKPLRPEARPPPRIKPPPLRKIAPAERIETRTSKAPPTTDARTSRRLRRGQIRPEARLDLHGLTQIEAHAALRSFLRSSRAGGRRCVLIVTGKGSITTGGVLRREVPRWLDEPDLRNAILGVVEAQPKDGGGGALYVLLRRAAVRG